MMLIGLISLDEFVSKCDPMSGEILEELTFIRGFSLLFNFFFSPLMLMLLVSWPSLLEKTLIGYS